MKFRSRNNTIESVLVLILLVSITLSIFLLLEGGSSAYNKIMINKLSFENARIANSYINIKIKQNDYGNNITLKKDAIEGEDAIIIEHREEELGLYTYIYFHDGILYECYVDDFDVPSLGYSEKIIEVDNVEFKNYKDDAGITINIEYIRDDKYANFMSIITFRNN